MAKTAKRASGSRRAPARKRSYRRRRNQPMMKNLIKQATDVAVGGAGVTTGEMANRQIIQMLRLDPNSLMGAGGQIIGAVALGMLLAQFKIKGPFADGVAYGAASSGFKSLVRQFAPPELADRLLSDYGGYGYGGTGLAAYATRPALPVGTNIDQTASLAAYASGVM